jgi:nitroreductase
VNSAPVRAAASRRRSVARVEGSGPSHGELVGLVEAAATVADHSGLRPWRLIEIRGDSRLTVGRAIATAAGATGEASEKLAQKPLRAPLLVGIVVSRRESRKVPDWEQEATAAGVAHLLSLLLDEAGWGVMWRTGPWTRSPEVREAHRLEPHEDLLGWLYVGEPVDADREVREPVDAETLISAL